MDKPLPFWSLSTAEIVQQLQTAKKDSPVTTPKIGSALQARARVWTVNQTQTLVGFSAVHDVVQSREISIEEAEKEVPAGWIRAYGADGSKEAMMKISGRPLLERAVILFARLAF